MREETRALRAAVVRAVGRARQLGYGQVETTQVYVHADLAIKEQALARTAPVDGRPGRYRPPDSLLAFLEALCHHPPSRTVLCGSQQHRAERPVRRLAQTNARDFSDRG